MLHRALDVVHSGDETCKELLKYRDELWMFNERK
jgi:hypothetical protein